MKIFRGVITAFLLTVFAFSSIVSAAELKSACMDKDNDGYFAYEAGVANSDDYEVEEGCKNRYGFKGVEENLCDCPTIKVGAKCDTNNDGKLDTSDGDGTTGKLKLVDDSSPNLSVINVYDPAKVKKTIRGRDIHVGKTDSPDDFIDQNCDGKDGVFVDTADSRNLDQLLQQGIQLLGTIIAAISVIVIIWGGIMYATAAGEEEKTKKARKTIIGALIGLILGLLARTIVSIVVSEVS